MSQFHHLWVFFAGMESLEGRQRARAGRLLAWVPHPHGRGDQVHKDCPPLSPGSARGPARNGIGGSHACR